MRAPNMGNPIHLLAFGFGSGLSKKMPGTVGTLASLLFVPLIWMLPAVAQMALIVVAFAVGVYLCGQTSKDMGVHDHGGIVWDEFVGMWLTLMFMPQSWLVVAIGFVWFRIFDILKPWPIKWFDQQVHGGLGIMLDDIIAAVFAWCALWLTLYWGGSWIL